MVGLQISVVVVKKDLVTVAAGGVGTLGVSSISSHRVLVSSAQLPQSTKLVSVVAAR